MRHLYGVPLSVLRCGIRRGLWGTTGAQTVQAVLKVPWLGLDRVGARQDETTRADEHHGKPAQGPAARHRTIAIQTRIAGEFSERCRAQQGSGPPRTPRAWRQAQNHTSQLWKRAATAERSHNQTWGLRRLPCTRPIEAIFDAARVAPPAISAVSAAGAFAASAAAAALSPGHNPGLRRGAA